MEQIWGWDLTKKSETLPKKIKGAKLVRRTTIECSANWNG